MTAVNTSVASKDQTETVRSEIEIDEKFDSVRDAAVHKFSRRGTAAGLSSCSSELAPAGQKSPMTASVANLDPRLSDYIYENTFSDQPAPTPVGSVPIQPISLEAARGLIFDLPAFKTAAGRVAYNEDLLTRAVSLLEGMTRCRLCGSNNTTFTVRQMHSSDEAPTMMLYCGSCHHRTNQTGE